MQAAPCECVVEIYGPDDCERGTPRLISTERDERDGYFGRAFYASQTAVQMEVVLSHNSGVVFDGEKMNDAGWLVPVAVVSGIAGILGVSSRLDKRRRQQWLEVATALGFEYLTV